MIDNFLKNENFNTVELSFNNGFIKVESISLLDFYFKKVLVKVFCIR